MRTSSHIEHSLFAPREIASITGVSAALQRDWRRRGILPKSETRFSANVYQLAELFCLRLLAEHGIGLRHSRAVVSSTGSAGSASGALRAPQGNGVNDLGPGLSSVGWRVGAYALIQAGAIEGDVRYAGVFIPRIEPYRFAAFNADGLMGMANAADAFFEASRTVPPLSTTILDLIEIGKTIAARAGRPLAKIITRELPDEGDQR